MKKVKLNSYKVKDFMTKKLVTAKVDETIFNICKLMKKNNIRSVPIFKDKKLTGLITSTDILYGLVLKNKNPKETLAKEIMSTKPVTISKEESDVVAAHLMKKKKVKHVLVTNKDKLVGLFTNEDLNKLFS